MNNDVIELRNVSKIIKQQIILNDISCSMKRGNIYGFMGANGSGKSMLFKAISGLMHIDSGDVCVFGKHIGKDCDFPQNLGCMFGANLWDTYSAQENLAVLASINKKINRDDITKTLIRVGLDPNNKRAVKTYSLGMKQRLDLAQAIMEQPELLILDEPSNALDAEGLGLLLDIIHEEHKRGCTILLSAHNTPELSSCCTKIFYLNNGCLSNGDKHESS